MRLFCLLLLLPFTVPAQSAHQEGPLTTKGWQELTIADGLSQGMIFGLRQDRNGFIWVATKDGLNRYDGHNFTVFTHDPYNPFSLSNNHCPALLLDRRGRLWVGTLNKGLNLFDDRTHRFYHVDIVDHSTPNSGGYEINLLSEDPDGNIWLATDNNKLFKISLPPSLQTAFPTQANFTTQVTIEPLPIPTTATENSVRYIRFQANGRATLGSSFGLYSFNWQHPAGIAKDSLLSRSSLDFHALYHAEKQDIWFAATRDNIVAWKQGVLKTIALPKTNNFSVNFDAIDPAVMAISATNYLWLMSPAELFAQDSLSARNAFVTLPPNTYSVTEFLKDQTGNLWIGTGGYGLRKFNPKIKRFRSYLPNTSLTELYADRQGRVYTRHQYAYQLLDRTTNQMVPFLDKKLPAADQRQRYLMQDRRGIFWVSNVNFETHEATLFKFSADWTLLKKYPLPPGTAFGFTGNQTLEGQTGYLWIGAANGKLLRFDPATETFAVFSYHDLIPGGSEGLETYALHQDAAGTLWIGTQKGLIRTDNVLANPTFSLYKNSLTDRLSLSYDFVSSLADDPYQPGRYLWIGTKGGGLNRLDRQTGNCLHITEAQGLPNKVVYGLLTDQFKNFWISTNRGLAEFSPKTFRFRNYTKGDGLQDDEFNTSSFVKLPSGELLFGGINGLTAFLPSALLNTKTRPPIANIINLKINNESIPVGGPDKILTESIDHTHRIDLAHDQNLLTVEFGVMDYTNSAQNQYRYRLSGIDPDWVNAGTNRFANYAQLPIGNYTFEMMGSADGQVWSKPVELQIWIHPPFYRTWWAYLFYALVLAVALRQLYLFQTQRWLLQQRLLFEQREAIRLTELDSFKTQFFTNISHEFRTPLTLLLGPLGDLKRKFPEESVLPMMERNGNRLLSLINQLLDLSKLEADQLRTELKRGDIASFLRTLAISFDSLAESQRIRFTFAQTETECWADFDADKMEKIVTNLLANAFKFTPAGNDVHMNVSYPESAETPNLQVIIEDTGIGIAPEDLAHIFERFYQRSAGGQSQAYGGTGIGLALVHELVRVLGGQVGVTSTVGQGTAFTVTLPLILVDKPVLPQPAATDSSLPGLQDVVFPVPLSPGISPLESEPMDTERILLIIDDNADIRAYVRTVFEADYRVIEAEDGQEGLEKAMATMPDIVICDLMMPRIDGFVFCRMLKTQEVTSHIPVVMLTAKATVQDRIEGFELGADDYLTKPFNRAELQVRVRNLVQQRQRLYQRFATGLMSIPINATPVSDGIEPAKPVLLAAEQKFLDRLSVVVLAHIDNAAFTVEALAEAVNMSRAQLFRKLKALTNTTASNYILNIRMVKAAQLLKEQEVSITQVAYAVGFDNPSYFTKVFKERYGVLPSQYGKSLTRSADTE
jgi:signal transduction histidine kinase/DNA-binding response OmpR family regulator/ligand-binding sensor domain-containing protein